ncbi:MAG: mediator of RNA polymerase II transcription subunit 8 [Bogoriella megaspora]|nr:MAG: mediator of RNA polymerase II transcription subunit 8 [Bogoriella megaspora]
MATLAADDKVLNSTRVQLTRISTALNALQTNLRSYDPLPSWRSIQESFNILNNSLKALQETINNNSSFLASAHVYPNPNFPARTQEGLLQLLLRKKLDPTAEDWLANTKATAAKIGIEEDEDSSPGGNDVVMTSTEFGATNGEQKVAKLESGELRELWHWAGPTENEMAGKVVDPDTFQDFTFEEQQQGIENVVTGLKRKLWEESESEGEDQDEEGKMEGLERAPKKEEKEPEQIKASVPLDYMLYFMSRGRFPETEGEKLQLSGKEPPKLR